MDRSIKNNKFGVKLELESDGGCDVVQCMPEVVAARVIRIHANSSTVEALDQKTSKREGEQVIIFGIIDLDGGVSLVKQTFYIGDVKPKLGQYVRGILVSNQWGSYNFIMTHLLKVKPDQVFSGR